MHGERFNRFSDHGVIMSKSAVAKAEGKEEPDLSLAHKKLQDYIIRGILGERFVPTFLSTLRKLPMDSTQGRAAVVLGEKGITLLYDRKFVMEASDNVLDFTFSHEIFHILNFHFTRGFELAGELMIPRTKFIQKYLPYADLPVNFSLKNHPGYEELGEKNMLTYDKTEMEHRSHPTLEDIVRYLHANRKEEDNDGQEQGQGAGGYHVIGVDEDGNTTDYGGDGPVIMIPEQDKLSAEEAQSELSAALEQTRKTAGNMPNDLRDALEQFLDENKPEVLKAWALLEHLLVGERATDKGYYRVYTKLNRRTSLPPGKKHITGFSVGFIVDESGSMSEDEIQTAFSLVKKICLQESNDKIFFVPWDTEPGEMVEIENEQDAVELGRTRSGGTNFEDMFSHKTVADLDVDLFVIVTDGYPWNWPQSPSPVPEIWIITEGGGYSHWESDYGKGFAVDVSEA